MVDSTVQNPSFVYAGCGDYNVTLTTTDASHAPSPLTRTAYIKTDNVTPGFTFATLAPGRGADHRQLIQPNRCDAE